MTPAHRRAAITLAAFFVIAAPAIAYAQRADDVVIVAPDPLKRRGTTPDRLFLNRCAAGCSIRDDGNDAYTDRSTIPDGDSTLSPFGFGDAAWTAVVQCVRDTYAPYGVSVVDAEPAAGLAYVEVMVAGRAAQLGLPANTLGIAPLTSDCSPQVGVLAFALANSHSNNVEDICATVAHEAGHVYGLDHAFECKDPMTYLVGCGHKVFLNVDLPCGEFDGTRDCKCRGASQNSHEVLTSALDAGEIPAAAMATITYPLPDETVPRESLLLVTTGEDETRVIIRMELWINGQRVREIAPPPDQHPTQLYVPASVGDGVLDIEVHVVTDLGQVEIASIRLVQGLGCDLVDACQADETCDSAGRCIAPVASAAVGDACQVDDDCAAQRCDDALGVCTQACVMAVADQCPVDFTCIPTDGVVGHVCWPDSAIDSGGCCDAGSSGSSAIVVGALAVLGLGSTRRRRLS